MKKGIITVILILFSISSLFSRDMTIAELTKKIEELEGRIEQLEKIISENDFQPESNTREYGSSIIANWRKLKTGMNEDQVRDLLGEPLHIIGGVSSSWEYPDYGSVLFFDGAVISWAEPEI